MRKMLNVSCVRNIVLNVLLQRKEKWPVALYGNSEEKNLNCVTITYETHCEIEQ